MHDRRYPNESEAYRAARDELLKAEIALTEDVARIAKMRRALPLGGAVKEDYVFTAFDQGVVTQVKLSELFAPGTSTLFLYSYMFSPQMEKPCPACTSIIDSFDGAAEHLRQRVSFAVVGKSPIERLEAVAGQRGWRNVPLLSSAGTTYNVDYGAENDAGNQLPAANVFVKRDGVVHHFWAAEQLYVPVDRQTRHMDQMWPLWNILDTTPEGRGEDWFPSIAY